MTPHPSHPPQKCRPISNFHTNHRKSTHTGNISKLQMNYERLQYHHIYNTRLHIYSHSCPGQYEHIKHSRPIHEHNQFMNLYHAFKQQWDWKTIWWVNKAMVCICDRKQWSLNRRKRHCCWPGAERRPGENTKLTTALYSHAPAALAYTHV